MEFNKIFAQMTFGNKTYQFDSAYVQVTCLIQDFYSEKELKDFHFFTFINNESQLNIAIADYNDELNYHQMYFCNTHNDEYYIDERNYVICNFSFLNDCGIDVSERSRQDSILFTSNLRNSKMEVSWNLDSCDGTLKFNQIEISEKVLYIDDSPEFTYSLYENDFQMDDTLFVNLRKVALSSERLILEDTKVPSSYFYLSKN